MEECSRGLSHAFFYGGLTMATDVRVIDDDTFYAEITIVYVVTGDLDRSTWFVGS